MNLPRYRVKELAKEFDVLQEKASERIGYGKVSGSADIKTSRDNAVEILTNRYMPHVKEMRESYRNE